MPLTNRAAILAALCHCSRGTCLELAVALADLVATPQQRTWLVSMHRERILPGEVRPIADRLWAEAAFQRSDTASAACLSARAVALALYTGVVDTYDVARISAANCAEWTAIALAMIRYGNDASAGWDEVAVKVREILLRDPSPELLAHLL